MYSNGPPHMVKQKQDDQLELTYSSYVTTRDVTLKSCQRRLIIGRSGKRGFGISVLAARHHDDDDIYIYIYIYMGDAFNKLPDFFCAGIENCRKHLKIHYVIVIHLMKWLINFYDFRFKSTATAANGIHPTKAWLSQLRNFKNAIWTRGHFRRMQ